jgi:NIPSNAP
MLVSELATNAITHAWPPLDEGVVETGGSVNLQGMAIATSYAITSIPSCYRLRRVAATCLATTVGARIGDTCAGRGIGALMIYELRIYQALPGKLAALMERFQNHTLEMWERHGIRQVGFWTTLVGPSQQRLTYMLVWDSMGDRERRWSAFLADPAWSIVTSESEIGGPLIEDISNEFLAPAPFSSLR